MTGHSLREDHRRLLPGIANLKETADLLFLAPVEHAIDETLQIEQFINHHLLPHARAEEQVFYAAVSRALGASEATDLMLRDHAEIERLAAELSELRSELTPAIITDEQRRRLRRLLYSIYAVLNLHLAKEDEILVPLLQQKLGREEAEQVAAAMERAAAELEAKAL